MGIPPTTVIMTVRDGESYVAEGLFSVLSQLGDDDEIIVVDDASTDGTRRILDRFGARLAVLKGEGRGPSAARNLGLGRARGSFVAFIDHDDLWPPGRHRALARTLIETPTASAAAGRIRIRVEDGAEAAAYLALEGLHAPSIPSTCLYRRELIDRAARFDEDMRYGEDLAYFIGLADAGMILVRCDHDALVYRRHAGNATLGAPTPGRTLLQILAKRLARARAAGERSLLPGKIDLTNLTR
ncbi:MAG: glycosyltransferase family 2 protein [Rhodospirillaceae bacterium]|nr:glycosyltransferase family 2 protein [Rhodospirillaceae bacterium]